MHTKQPPHSVFTENLVIACLTNTIPGAPAATKHIMELRKRRRQDDEEDTVYQNDVQQISMRLCQSQSTLRQGGFKIG